MKAYWFCKADMTAGHGNEPPWTVGETRTIDGPLVPCEHGYHSSPTLLEALQYAPGPMLCAVDVPEIGTDTLDGKDKLCSRSRTLAAVANVERELRLFAAECAERALLRERERGREPDQRSWAAVEAARQYARGEIDGEQLVAARDAAWAAAWDAAGVAAWDAAWDAAGVAARDAAWAATRARWRRAAEREWQAQRLDEMLLPLLKA